jgi:DNA mismatch repair protein MutS
VLWLEKKKSSFIFATHCHDLVKEKRIKELNAVHFYHLAVKYNEETKVLEYTRKLQKGSGSAIYGLEVCRAMDLDNEFLELANTIRTEYVGNSEDLVSRNKSNYNKTVYMDKCGMCQQNISEETHHIEEQQIADCEGFIGYQHKNKKCNLIPLCKECHAKITYGQKKISPKMMTSEGVKITITEEDTNSMKSLKKFNLEEIKQIKEWKQKGMKNLNIQENTMSYFNKKISSTTISRIITNKY